MTTLKTGRTETMSEKKPADVREALRSGCENTNHTWVTVQRDDLSIALGKDAAEFMRTGKGNSPKLVKVKRELLLEALGGSGGAPVPAPPAGGDDKKK